MTLSWKSDLKLKNCFFIDLTKSTTCIGRGQNDRKPPSEAWSLTEEKFDFIDFWLPWWWHIRKSERLLLSRRYLHVFSWHAGFHIGWWLTTSTAISCYECIRRLPSLWGARWRVTSSFKIRRTSSETRDFIYKNSYLFFEEQRHSNNRTTNSDWSSWPIFLWAIWIEDYDHLLLVSNNPSSFF